MKNFIKFLSISLLLMSFQCDDEHYERNFPTLKIKVTENNSFRINDTIWVRGIISSKLYDSQVGDSVFYNDPYIETLSIMKLVLPNNLRNSIGASANFNFINQIGILNTSYCEESNLDIETTLNNNNFYEYKIGIIPLNSGAYFISSSMGKIINSNKNENILTDYVNSNIKNSINFERCGFFDSRLTNESESEFFFKVE